MTARIISFCLQKGGVGKTMTCGISAFLLAQQGYRVLTIDFDSQGNLTELLLQQDIYEFRKRTALEAVIEGDVRPYIVNVNGNLDIVPAEDLLAGLARYIYVDYPKTKPTVAPSYLLKRALAGVQDEYDFIFIDLPPNLGEQTVNGLAASTHLVIPFQTEGFSHSSLDRFMYFVSDVIQDQGVNPDIEIAGILPTMMDNRTSLDAALLGDVRTEWNAFVFNAVINRKARIKEFVITGIQTRTKADRDALESHEAFVKELLERVNQSGETTAAKETAASRTGKTSR